MSDEFPDSWKIKTIEEVCEKPQYGFTASAFEKKIGPKLVRITDITEDRINWESVPYCECEETIAKKYLLEKGDLLFARTGTTGASTLITDVPERAVFASYLIRLKPKKEIETYYLNQFFKSSIYWKQITQKQVGAIQKGINASVLTSIILPYPPLVEQRGIAEVLGTVDEAIRRTDAVISKAEELKRGLRQRLLTRGMGHTEFKPSELGEIPLNWEIKEMKNVFEIEMGQSPSGDSYNTNKMGTPLLNGPSEFGELYPTPVQWTTTPTKMSQPGDVLFCVRGNTAGRINISNGKYCIGRGIAAIRQIDGISNNMFIRYTFENLELIFLKIATGAGSTFPNVKKSDIESMKLRYSDLSEQIQIGNILSSTDEKISFEKNRLKKYQILKQGIMQLLLSGRVRVRLDEGGLHRVGDG